METMKAKEVTIKSDDVEVVLHDCDIIIEDESDVAPSHEKPKENLKDWAKAGLYLVLCIVCAVLTVAIWTSIFS